MRSWAAQIRRVLADREGNLAILTAFLMVPMVLVVGGAMDLVVYERARLALQDALDRGTLAAASLSQTKEPQALVKSYVDAVPAIKGAQVSVSDDHKPNLRKVTAQATIRQTTAFLKLAGIGTLVVTAASTAQEKRSNIEVSVVLDISGSMYDNGGLAQLKPAAKSFLDVVLKDDLRATTSVSIIPFAGAVNLGFGVFNLLSGYVPSLGEKDAGPNANGQCDPSVLSLYARRHCYSSCFEMVDADFKAGTPLFPKRDQVPHFSVYNISAKGKLPWWCPTDSAAVSYLTNDITYLKQRIDALAPYDGTGTAYGMKWAELLLNPAMRPTVATIGNTGLAPIPAEFRNRPADFGSADTLKFIVLMTDGQIGFQPRPVGSLSGNTGTAEVTDKNVTGSNSKTVYTEAQSAAFYKQVCDYAKAEGITIFTVAFKVDAAVAKSIAACASDQSYALKVDGLDMSTAFQFIATSMQKIRLVN
ncbi:pilus assembly protein TadG-related protein [Methylobacterium sp. ID0610]|uniref:pilus assembly protein TadG-related protein n=1 Tax=Methylobacterium carpenticola TaxID=3344827 RepID=UPI0036B3C36A